MERFAVNVLDKSDNKIKVMYLSKTQMDAIKKAAAQKNRWWITLMRWLKTLTQI